MLHYPETRILDASMEQQAGQKDGDLAILSLDKLLAALRRQMWFLVLGAAIGLFVGFGYLMTAVPLYTASTDIMIDKGKSRTITELSDASTNLVQDDAEILSQVELLKSANMARAVAANLNLAKNERFMSGVPSMMGSAIGALSSVRQLLPSSDAGPLAPIDDEALQARAASILVSNVNVSRAGRTYILNLTYTSPYPSLAAQIAQAYAAAYLDDQLNAKYDATRRASEWLETRITDLKAQSFKADLAVQKFRRDNNLISSNGQLISEQQIGEINTQLITAQTATAEAKARYDQINELIKDGRTDAVVNDALVSSTINNLREKYLDASRRETEISNKLGPNHVQAIRLRDEMKEYERLIFGELGRIAESYGNAYKVAMTRQKSLEENLSGAVDVSAGDNTTQVQLRELEREADTFKTLYENFLQRYQETIQQQSFPVTEARVISAASIPGGASAPKKPLVIAMFLILGLGAGVGMAAYREHRERFFRVGDQVRSELGQEFLGYIPLVTPARGRAADDVEKLDPTGGGLWTPASPNAYVRSHPMSSFAEALRNAKVAVDLTLADQSSKVVGIVSSLPWEGKSTTASNLAVLLAMQGARTLLIDGDIRNPGITRSLATKPATGLIEAVLDGHTLGPHLLWDASQRLAVLPTVLERRISHSSELLTSLSMASLLDQARASFDYVIVDLPPLGPIIDAKAFSGRVDAFVFVAEWGRTPRSLVRSILANHAAIRTKTLGVLLTKADETKMRYYRAYGSSEYFQGRYSGYYRD